MSHPLDPTGVVELAVLSRSGLDESRHLGAAVVVSPDGTIARTIGDADALVYGRSSLKFFQAIAVLRSGVALEGAQLVLATASHAGTAAHVAVVRSLLERAGLGEEALQCPLDWPLDSASRSEASAPARITMNCSGKHAAFLLACVQNGWPTRRNRCSNCTATRSRNSAGNRSGTWEWTAAAHRSSRPRCAGSRPR